MPLEVQQAYRDPIDLLELLMSDAYSDADRVDVRDTLLLSMLEKHGDVWIASRGKDVPVSTLATSSESSVYTQLRNLLYLPDYGGLEETLPALADAMNPMWALWWESFEWNEGPGISTWRSVVECVFGTRQFAWLSAQHARTSFDFTREQDRGVCLLAIEAAEAWARAPSRLNSEAAEAAYDAVLAARESPAAANAASAAYYALSAASAAVRCATYTRYSSAYDRVRDASYASRDAAYSAAYSVAYATYDTAAFVRLASVTKRLFTPTLVTSASRGLRPRR